MSDGQIKELFSDTKDELDAKVEQLEETSTKLQSTKEKLHCTKEVHSDTVYYYYSHQNCII